GVDDTVDDGDVAYTILTAAATSNDPLYNGRDAADVSVTNIDNDETAPDLVPTIRSAPATATSGTSVLVEWRVTNTGTDTATGTWSDRVYLSTNATYEAGDTLLGTLDH